MSHGGFYRCSYCVSGPGNISVTLLSMKDLSMEDLLDFIKNILICIPKMNKGLMGLVE